MHYLTTPAIAYTQIRLVTAAAAKDGERRHFNAEEAFLETSVGEKVFI